MLQSRVSDILYTNNQFVSTLLLVFHVFYPSALEYHDNSANTAYNMLFTVQTLCLGEMEMEITKASFSFKEVRVQNTTFILNRSHGYHLFHSSSSQVCLLIEGSFYMRVIIINVRKIQYGTIHYA